MKQKQKTLVIDPHTNKVVDVLDIDITHTDANFILRVWLNQLADHKKDPKRNPLPDRFKDKIGFLAHWPVVVFAVEVKVGLLPSWYSKVLPDLAKEEKRLMDEAFSETSHPA